MKAAYPMRRVDSLRLAANDLRLSRDEAHIEALAERMRLVGFNDPLRIRDLPGGVAEVMGGGTRLLAARRAGLAEVPVIVEEKQLSDDEAEKEQFLDNHLRADFTLIERATFYARRMERHGWSQKQLAEDLGETEVEISRALRAFKRLPPPVHEMIAQGKLCGSFAPIIARLKSEEDMLTIAARACEGGMKRDAVERWVRAKLGKQTKKAKPVKLNIGGVAFTLPGDMTYQAAEKVFQAALQRIQKGKQIAAAPADAPVFLNGV